MYDVAVTIGIFSAAGIFAYLALHPSEESKAIKFIFLILALIFIYNGLATLFVLSYYSGEYNVNFTSEDSRYWNCSFMTGDCTGEPDSMACLYFNQVQCNAIDNCTWIIDQDEYCDGVIDWNCSQLGAYGGEAKCEEAGCAWNYTLELGLCDEINTTYDYKRLGGFEERAGTVLATMQVTQWVIVFIIFVFFLVLTVGLMDDLKKAARKKRGG